LLKKTDRKIAFVTPWDTYAYVHMPFGLKNARETFQREMDHTFQDLIGKFMADYQDDLTIHSNLREEHIKHLRNSLNFVDCMTYL
jgi:hypothetical protein